MSDAIKKTVYITKYALTSGMYKAQVTQRPDSPYVSEGARQGLLKMGRDAFDTLEQAVADVKTKIQRKLKTLKKAEAKLEKLAASLDFEAGP